jgi:ATP-dependent DNA ligase
MSLRERTRPGLGIIEPCLPSPAKVPLSGSGWLHEIKHDGFRILARRDGAGVRLFAQRPRFHVTIMPTVDTRHRQKTFCTGRP